MHPGPVLREVARPFVLREIEGGTDGRRGRLGAVPLPNRYPSTRLHSEDDRASRSKAPSPHRDIIQPVGAWRSQVAHLHGVQGAARSNRAAPTIPSPHTVPTSLCSAPVNRRVRMRLDQFGDFAHLGQDLLQAALQVDARHFYRLAGVANLVTACFRLPGSVYQQA